MVSRRVVGFGYEAWLCWLLPVRVIMVGVEFFHGVLGGVASFGGLPFVVGVGQDRADQPDDGGFVGEDADHAGTPFDFLVDPL